MFLDSTFSTNGRVVTSISPDDEFSNALVVQPDGKILIGGNAFEFGLDSDFGVARYNPNGTLDTSFGSNGIATTNFNFDEDGRPLQEPPPVSIGIRVALVGCGSCGESHAPKTQKQ